MKKGFSYLCFTLLTAVMISCLISGDAEADTLILNDGTLLVGKVKEEDRSSITFRNYYGIFRVPREQIENLYKTKSYAEDIALRRKLGLDFNEADIRKNYKAGLKKITDKERAQQLKETKKDKEVKTGRWAQGRISAEGAFMMTMGELSDSLPTGMGAFISFDQGPDFLTGGMRNSFIPGIRIEWGYLSFTNGDNSLKGYTASAGPMWLFPQWNHNGRFHLALQPGISMLDGETAEETASITSFTMHSILGYQYPMGNFSFFANARHSYIYDKDVVFHNIGISAGISLKLW